MFSASDLFCWRSKKQKLLYHSSRSLNTNIPMTLSPDDQWLTFGIKDRKHSIILLEWENAKIEQLDRGYISLAWSSKGHQWNAFHYREQSVLNSNDSKVLNKYKKRTIHSKPKIEHVMHLSELDDSIQLQISQRQNTTFSAQLCFASEVIKDLILSNNIHFNFKVPLTMQILYQRYAQSILWVEKSRDIMELKSISLDLSSSKINLGSVTTVTTFRASKFNGMFLKNID